MQVGCLIQCRIPGSDLLLRDLVPGAGQQTGSNRERTGGKAMLGVDLATIQEAAANVEPYICADGVGWLPLA
jgi:hypothetical protein